MRNYKVKEIHALARGLEVLKMLQEMHAGSLHDLHRATGIPKSTLTRILYTLYRQGYIWQRMADGAFLPSLSSQYRSLKSDDKDWLVELVSPYLEHLCERVKWPSVLCVPRLDYMEVIETNSPKSYFDEIPLGPIGYRANMLRSASGRAYLSFCPDQEREAILQRLREKDTPGHRLAWDSAAIEALITNTRANGYSCRAPDFGGHYDKPREESDDGRESIAVPIRLQDRVLGCINLTWRIRVISKEKAVATLLPELFATAEKISIKIKQEILPYAQGLNY
ncbi:helix-turn-helix domain-containing protein (plasmid) [Pseudomonas putida]|uniref:helix-turn-helix domain-containing protein n=1 Tax=Pseudomonas putida TaxID=303 RepID=UPI001BAF5118|nr:helix-turn-helix domain-containing protein [Pseudomonas putida]QUG92771.1 helix-turn-helix domain-containing protein [Pseudomonas putida]